MGISRGNCSKIQGLETVELCLDMKPKVTQVTLAERAHEEGVPGSDRSPTGVSSSAV